MTFQEYCLRKEWTGTVGAGELGTDVPIDGEEYYRIFGNKVRPKTVAWDGFRATDKIKDKINPRKMFGMYRKVEGISHSIEDFHAAMHDDPKELTNHLVYADFIEEQGMPLTANIIRNDPIIWIVEFPVNLTPGQFGIQYLKNFIRIFQKSLINPKESFLWDSKLHYKEVLELTKEIFDHGGILIQPLLFLGL